jgi:twinkle protein
MTTLAERLLEQGIRPRHFKAGSQKLTCPHCSQRRTNKTDPCLSLKIDDMGATWNCHHCGLKGAVSDRPTDTGTRKTEKMKTEDVSAVSMGPVPTSALDWFAKRGISAKTVDRAGVGWGRRWITRHNKECDVIVFPYRRKPGGEIVNAKFRTGDKAFTQVSGGEKIFWGIDAVDSAHEAVVIVEGELDKLACDEAGVVNAISVPDGAPEKVRDGEIDPSEDAKFAFVWNCREDLDRFSRIVLATDADGPGQALAEELARRFGRERCSLVTWPSDCKDANDVLLKHGAEELRARIAAAKLYPIKGLFEASNYFDDVAALYRGGRKRGLSTGWESLDEFMTIRPGELSVVTGVPGSGKSEFVDALMMNLANTHGWRFALCSFENPPDEHLVKLAEKFCLAPFHDGPRMRMTEADLRRALSWLNERFSFIRADDDSPTIDWILEKAKGAVMRHGIKGLVIDPYNEIDHRRPAGKTETEYVSDILAKVKRFAQAHGVHVWFVAHPKNMQRDKDGEIPVPSLYDIAGSAHWVNKADIGIVVDRNWEPECEGEVEIHVKKVRFKAVGRVGSATLHYDRATGLYADPKINAAYAASKPGRD